MTTVRFLRDTTQEAWTQKITTTKTGMEIRLGFPEEPESCRRAGAWAMQLANQHKAQTAQLKLSSTYAREVAEGVAMGSYVFDAYKEIPQSVTDIEFLEGQDEDIEEGMYVGDLVNYARDLINTPANDMTPTDLAKEAKAIKGVRVTIRDEKWMKQKGMNCILAVNKGSAQPPKFIELAYGPEKNHIALVGKGVTFDSGGLNIKLQMLEEMKMDMGGAAAVLALFKAAAEKKLAIGLRGYIPAVENMTGSSAQHTGDIITSYSGKTVEVINTDAEGRLILADALAYAAEKKPSQIIDFATLTGACIVALGHEASAILGDDAVCKQLLAAGEKSGDRTWQLPLWDVYEKFMDSDIADVANLGERAQAGTIQGAVFLQKFVPKNIPWVHIDIAGTAFRGKPPVQQPNYLLKGANAGGVRAVLEYLRTQEKKK